MRNQGVALHLADADPAALRPSFDWLARDGVDGPRGPDLELIADHVPEPLVVHDAEIYVGGELAARDAAVHGFVAVEVVARLQQLVAEEVACSVCFVEGEGRAVLCEAVEGASFAGQGLDEHADCHAGGEGVRVDDDVGLDAGFAEGHGFAGPEHGADALLAVAGGEFVADDGAARDAVFDGDALEGCVAGFGPQEADLVDVTGLAVFVLEVVGLAVEVAERVGGGVEHDGVVGGYYAAFLDFGADFGKAVFFNVEEDVARDVCVGVCEAEHAFDLGFGS